ncbi:interferon alpha-inducible protein 27-like protein 2 isoform X3 [Delphinus delphis]|uniref:interferon alpha-inducible protein 27-like protein 2 isoform X3 n=1 Tax=Delphinus delphis TaxID=9728 RepID=UPI003750C5A7
MIKRAAAAAIGGGDFPGSPHRQAFSWPGSQGGREALERWRCRASLAVGAVPVVLGAVGFTGAGIAASSLAAKMMSAAAMANGGGVAAGSLVATLQSVGGPRAEGDQPGENVPQVEPPKLPLGSEKHEK